MQKTKLITQESNHMELEKSKSKVDAKEKYQLANQLLKQWYINQTDKLIELTMKIEEQKSKLDKQELDEKIRLQKESTQNLPESAIKTVMLKLNVTMSNLYSQLQELQEGQSTKITTEELENSSLELYHSAKVMKSVIGLSEKIDNIYKLNENSVTEIDRLIHILKMTHDFLINPTKENATIYLEFAMKIDGAPSKTGLSKSMNSICKKNASLYYSSISSFFPPFSDKKSKELEVLKSDNVNIITEHDHII